MSFRRMGIERIINKEPGAKDITTYDPDDIEEYYYIHSTSIQLSAATQAMAAASQTVM